MANLSEDPAFLAIVDELIGMFAESLGKSLIARGWTPPPGIRAPSAPLVEAVAVAVVGRVYFFRADITGHVKIGFTVRDLASRAREIGHHVGTITVLGSMTGTVADEQALHARFAEHRRHGEWFAPAPELLAFIEALPKAGP